MATHPDLKRSPSKQRPHVELAAITSIARDGPVEGALPESDQRLLSLGYKPEFRREMSLAGVLGISFCAIGILTGMSSAFQTGLFSGGPLGEFVLIARFIILILLTWMRISGLFWGWNVGFIGSIPPTRCSRGREDMQSLHVTYRVESCRNLQCLVGLNCSWCHCLISQWWNASARPWEDCISGCVRWSQICLSLDVSPIKIPLNVMYNNPIIRLYGLDLFYRHGVHWDVRQPEVGSPRIFVLLYLNGCYSVALYLASLAEVGQGRTLTRVEIAAMAWGVNILSGILNTVGTKAVSRMSSFSVWWTLGGTFVLVITLLVKAPVKVSNAVIQLWAIVLTLPIFRIPLNSCSLIMKSKPKYILECIYWILTTWSASLVGALEASSYFLGFFRWVCIVRISVLSSSL